MKMVFFSVPTYSNDFAVELSNANVQHTINLQHPVLPVQKSQNINEYNGELFTEPEASIYGKNENISRGYIVNDFFDNGYYHVVSVLIPMLAYNPYANTIQYYSSIDVNLKYKETSTDALGSHPLMSLKDVLRSDYTKNVLNSALLNLNYSTNISNLSFASIRLMR